MNKLTKYACILTTLAGAVACSGGKKAQGDYAIIPLPQEVVTQGSAPFLLKPSTPISYQEGDAEMEQTARFLASYVKEATGYEPKVITGNADKGIHLSIASDIRNPEGYRLLVSENGIEIAGASNAGIFYGVQTLRKSIPAVAEGMDIELPAASINDYPRFPYRGMHLDVSRHFFPVDSVKKFIDILALHNMNRFHWHLTDDQGWRIEIKKYPELTQIGAQRKETVIGRNSGKYDGKPYGEGMFYTQDEIRDVIAYAQERFITIIPEIDLPGHQLAAITTYPDLGCTGGPYEVWTQWGVSDDVICAGNEKAMTFLEDVLGEVIDLFPSEYIHVGGDEAGKSAWKKCPKCQALMKEKGMKNVDELQSYMIHRAEEFLNSKDRKLIGWDEILEGGLAPEATVMSWRGEDGGIKSARMGHDVVMTPGNYMYLDFYQADPKTQPYAIGGYTPIKKVYSYNPVPADSLTAEECRHILGVQANTWTEYIQTPEHLEYMMFPRALAVAEIGWTPQELRTWEDFKPRMNAHISKLQGMGIRTFTLSDELEVTMQVDTAGRKIEVILDAEKYPAEVRYNTVGRDYEFTEVRVIDPETGEECPVGVQGEMCNRGYNTMKGYYNNPAATAEVIDKDGFLHSGDLGVKDEHGNYRITGRIKDMIIRGGENIYPRELEEFLYHLEGVKDVQVAAVPSKKYGEEVGAFIILHEGVTMTEDIVKDFCRGKIARHKIPKYIFFVDTFPMTGSGKIQKFKLKDLGLKLLADRGITPV